MLKEAYNLDRMIQLMNMLGNPQDGLKVLHVAGTSGKTSTAYYLTALLMAHGQRVGLTVSPHLDSLAERAQINLNILPEAEFCRYFSEFINLPGVLALDPTYFELMVAFAYWYFAKAKVDYAVVEVGLGGLSDATNVINNPDKVCVITDIGYDHMQVLGDSLPKIAHQKAGIITNGNQAFMMQQSPQIVKVVQQQADRVQANLRVVLPHRLPQLADLPPFAARNWQLAKAATDFVARRDGLTATTDLLATAGTVVPARMETRRVAGKTLIIDGSHNQQKLAALTAAIQQQYPGQKAAVLFSFVNSRADRLDEAVQALAPVVGSVIVTSYRSDQDLRHQSLEPAVMARAFRRASVLDCWIEPQPAAAFARLLQQPEPVRVVTGSFYLLNQVRPLIINDDDS